MGPISLHHRHACLARREITCFTHKLVEDTQLLCKVFLIGTAAVFPVVTKSTETLLYSCITNTFGSKFVAKNFQKSGHTEAEFQITPSASKTDLTYHYSFV